jgi:hypothetical protein
MASKYDIVVPTIGKIAPLKDLFLFDLANRYFLLGTETYIAEPSNFQRKLLTSAVFSAILVIIVLPQWTLPLQLFLLGLIFAGLGFVWGWMPYRDRLLSREGRLIQGRIIENDQYRTRLGSIPEMPLGPVRISRVYYGWEVSALCAFRTPDGKVLSTRRRAIRNDLKNKAIIDGTPIVVLYRNPRHFKVL